MEKGSQDMYSSETITAKEIIQDLQKIQMLTIRRWIYGNKIPGKLSGGFHIPYVFDRKIYLKWKKEKYPAIRDKYLFRSRHKYMYTRDQLKEICEKETGYIIPGKIIQRWIYKDLPVDATKKQVKQWFKSERGGKLIKFVISEDHPTDIEKICIRPCGKNMKYKKGKRCIEYTDCPHGDECLDFFDDMSWHGWVEV